jgi:hypothetical protein
MFFYLEENLNDRALMIQLPSLDDFGVENGIGVVGRFRQMYNISLDYKLCVKRNF